MKHVLICLVTTALWTGSVTRAGATPPADRFHSVRHELSALNAQASENNTKYRDLVLVEVPDVIESLALKHQFDEAKDLAQLKLSTGIRLFGAQSITALDALQDLLFLAVQQHDQTERDKYLKQYAQLTLEMKHSHHENLVETANIIRKRRLERKAEAAEAILQGHM